MLHPEKTKIVYCKDANRRGNFPDIRFDFFHSVAAMYLKAAIGPNGLPTAWLQRTVYPPINSTFGPATSS